MATLTKKYIKKARTKPGGSNVGKYKEVKSFAGPSGGAPEGSYPINSLSRAISALKLAHNAPNPSGIKSAVYRKYPQLKPTSAQGGGMRLEDTYRTGGLPNWLYKARGRAMRNKMQAGGMYDENVIPRGVGASANIVYQESNPAILASKRAALDEERARLIKEGNLTEQELKNLEEKSKGDIARAAAAGEASVSAGFETGASILGTGLDVAKEAGVFKTPKPTVTPSVTPGVVPPPTYGAGLIGPAAAPPAVAPTPFLGGPTVPGAETGIGAMASTGATTAGKFGGAGVGTGVGKWASSGAGLGTIASLAGTGIKMLSSDDDPTTWTAGEATGDILSSAGAGAGYGSFLGPGGTLVGGVLGGLYGLGKGLLGRKQARKKEKEAKDAYEAEKKRRVTKYNEQLSTGIASQRARVRAAELASKTYSGYDVGRNITAQLGGMRMGMPRYGYAA